MNRLIVNRKIWRNSRKKEILSKIFILKHGIENFKVTHDTMKIEF